MLPQQLWSCIQATAPSVPINLDAFFRHRKHFNREFLFLCLATLSSIYIPIECSSISTVRRVEKRTVTTNRRHKEWNAWWRWRGVAAREARKHSFIVSLAIFQNYIPTLNCVSRTRRFCGGSDMVRLEGGWMCTRQSCFTGFCGRNWLAFGLRLIGGWPTWLAAFMVYFSWMKLGSILLFFIDFLMQFFPDLIWFEKSSLARKSTRKFAK